MKPEILAPAGSGEALYAAVRSGADAVYLGADEFSARRNAENFDRQKLREAAEYCHIRGVKVYLTLNILIKDSELEAAFSLAKYAYEIGVDALIVQDIGLASVLHALLPELPLHASTQLSVHSSSALKTLKKLGFCRVVAAREMSADGLRELCGEAAKLGMTVEVFVHGALCMSVSGQCLLSAFFGSRSGNRGLCAGPCRLPFSVNGGTGYDLSLKDLSLIKYIPDLADMGVASLKIEGRMKRPEYVAAVTDACLNARDVSFCEALEVRLSKVFSRSGFTDGYYTGNTGKDMFGIRTKDDVVAADTVFGDIHGLYRKERKSVAVKITAALASEKPVSVTFTDGKNTVFVSGEAPQTAKTRPTSKEDITAGLSKLGDTPYFAESVSVTSEDGLFVSAGALNALRREAVALLDEKRKETGRKPCEAEFSHKALPADDKTPVCVCRFADEKQIPQDLSGISAVALALEASPEADIPEGIIKIADLPRGITDEELLLKRLLLFKNNGFKYAACGNIAQISIAGRAGMEIIAGFGMNIYNSESVNTIGQIGARAVLLSPEMTLAEARFSSEIKKGIIGYGNIPLMLLKNCPLKNGGKCAECDKKGVITDRLGVSFPVNCRMGYSELFNSVPIWLADRKNELSGLDFYVLYFTRETPERAAEVINMYKTGAAPDLPHTRGLYYRGVL